MDKLYIVIPAYNEEANIAATIADWYPVVEKHDGNGESRLLIIDDGSRDATGSVLDEEAKNRPLMEVIHKENSGHGPTILYGYKYACEAGADFVFQTDSDGQTLSREFEPFWRQRVRFDMVVGRRAGRQDGLMRSAVSKTLSGMLFVMFGIRVDDANTPYRLMKAYRLNKALQYIDEDEELTNIMLSVIYKKLGWKVLYRDITFRKRQGGRNSLDPGKIFDMGTASFKRFNALAERLKRE